MDFVQDRITTVHDVGTGAPSTSPGSFAAIVPMVDRELEADHGHIVLEAIASRSPERIIVPVRADAETVRSFVRWADEQSAPIDTLWCNAPSVEERLDGIGDRGAVSQGKGNDVWLAMGVAATQADVVCCFDADVTSLGAAQVARLVAPIGPDVAFSKAYYARIEGDRMYGRLFRLLYRPLVRALDQVIDDPVVAYLDSFRYALSGEFAVRSDAVLEWSFPVDMGLEVGLLGEAYTHAGFEATAQVDLGRHRHSHRPVEGPDGLRDIAPQVTGAIFDILDRAGVGSISPQRLEERYRACADRLIEQYRRTAAINGLRYDLIDERRQVAHYTEAIRSPQPPVRMPSWSSLALEPDSILECSDVAIARARDTA